MFPLNNWSFTNQAPCKKKKVLFLHLQVTSSTFVQNDLLYHFSMHHLFTALLLRSFMCFASDSGHGRWISFQQHGLYVCEPFIFCFGFINLKWRISLHHDGSPQYSFTIVSHINALSPCTIHGNHQRRAWFESVQPKIHHA